MTGSSFIGEQSHPSVVAETMAHRRVNTALCLGFLYRLAIEREREEGESHSMEVSGEMTCM
jgi:hypothetical protein